MPHYKLLFLRKNGRVHDRFDFEAPDDTYAQDAAEELRGACRRQLWCGERRLRSWDALAAA